MTSPEPVSTPDDLRPGLEEYKRWEVAALVFGPLAGVGYTTTAPALVTSIGAIAGMLLAQGLAPVAIRAIFRPWQRKR